MPTGVAIRDPRGQLFGAAERVLLRDGPAALTSRAVTDEAGVAKGVLHRHFADFDQFLAELALDRIARVNAKAAVLRAAAGTGTVAGNLAAALPELFTPPLLALARLVFARDELRARLRASTGSRLPVMSECVALAAGYLEAERDLGRIAPGADLATLAPMLVSAVHMLFTDTDGPPPGQADVTRVVTAALATAGSRLPGGAPARMSAARGHGSVERYVFDGKYVTAAGVSAGIDMALALAARIAGDDVAMAIQFGIEYDPRPPFTAGSPATAPARIVAAQRAASRFAGTRAGN